MREITINETNNVSGADFGSAAFYLIAGAAIDYYQATVTHQYLPVATILGAVIGFTSLCCDRNDDYL